MTHRVIVLEDDESLRLVMTKALSRAGFQVRATASPETAITQLARKEADALVADVLLGNENFLERLDEVARLRPDAPVIIISAQTTAATAIGANLGGAFEYLPKPFDLNVLSETVRAALEGHDAAPRAPQDSVGDLIGRSPAMQSAFKAIGRLARSHVPVLITGPDGSGRATAGRMLHRKGAPGGPLVDAGPQRFEKEAAELWSAARGGSLLLRRAEDWGPFGQAFLRERLEAEQSESVRLIVTAGEQAERHLPAPLFDHLAVGRITLPPVRERGEDRSLLFEAFLKQESPNLQLSDSARALVDASPWPGEALQLRRVARQIAAQSPKTLIEREDVEDALPSGPSTKAEHGIEDAAARFFAEKSAKAEGRLAEAAQSALERGLVRAALAKARGVRLEAAKLLGMNRNTFARKLSRLDDDAED